MTATTARPAALTVAFRVAGRPIPQGSKRIGRHGAKAVILDANDAALKSWRTQVAHAAHVALQGRAPIDGPVSVTAVFTLQRPAGHYGRTGKLRPSAPALPAVKPDLDKMQRAIGDALSLGPLRVITDDSRIVHWQVTKIYGPPGVSVQVSRVAESVAS